MSFADYDDIFCICCEWSKNGMRGGELIFRKNILFGETSDEDRMLPQENRWWETAEKEIKSEKEKVLI